MQADQANGGTEQAISLLPQTASDSAVRFLRAMIFSGELGPGDRLPPERDLGVRLGISRMTLRLALKALESTGYIVTTRGSRGGSRVSGEPALLECWDQWMRRHLGELGDIFELRTTVETRLAALAAERRSQQDLDAMEGTLAKERGPQDWSSLFRTDMDLHKSIARAARSPRLEQAMMAARGDLFIPVNLHRLEGSEPRVHDTHSAIFEAIRDRDPSAAAERMRQHIEQVRRLVERAVAESGIS
jgi:GntR family transcriptional repressor for pyruvate dehydrogenase complex